MIASPAIVRRIAAWGVGGAACLGALGFVVDAVLLFERGHTSARIAIAGGAAAFALAVLVAFVTAPAVALLEDVCVRIAARKGWVRWMWPAPIAALVTAVGIAAHGSQGSGAWAIALFVTTAVVCAFVATWQRRAAATTIATTITAAALVADRVVGTSDQAYLDLLTMVALLAALAATARVRRRVREARRSTVVVSAFAFAAAAISVLAGVDRGAPGWRARSETSGRFAPTLGRSARALFDADGDGFSSLLWGGDCDDLDSSRSPRARQRLHDVDDNCNGVTPPARPSDVQVGLAPAHGDPNLPAGIVDRVVLVTIDCWRADALRADVMPRVAALGERGLVMSRAYATGTRTASSLALAQRGRASDPTIAARLARGGVASTVVFGYGVGAEPNLDGFGVRLTPDFPRERWPASRVTDLAIEALRAARGRTYVWAHYLDAHDPLDESPPAPEVPRPLGVPPSYFAALAIVDGEIGRLFDAVEASDGFSRTMVIVSSDHGEGFGAHGVDAHGFGAYEQVVHVPAILVAPALAPGRYDGVVSHRDWPATILGAFALAEEASEDVGRSWLRLRAAPGMPLHAFVVVHSSRGYPGGAVVSPMAAIVEPDRKLIETFENRLVEMYDPVADPDEETDLAPSEPEVVARLRGQLALYRDLDEAH